MSTFQGIGLDWRLVLAQVVNFALLAWVLARFLYRPMIGKIEEYEKEIADAKRKRKELDDEKVSIDEEKKRVVTKAKEESRDIIRQAEEMAEKITMKADTDTAKEVQDRLQHVDELIDAQKGPMKEQYKRDLKSTLRERLPVTFADASVIGPDALDAVQAGMRDGFVDSLKDVAGMEGLARPEEVTVRCGRPVSEKDKKAIVAALRKFFGKALDVRFETDPAIAAGFNAEIAGTIVERDLLSVLSREIDAA